MNKVFVYRDREGASRIWQENFIRILKEMRKPFIEIPFEGWFERAKSRHNIAKKIEKHHKKGDVFIARFNERKESLIKPMFEDIVAIFGERYVFPDMQAAILYNNKREQSEWFNRHGYPAPAQRWVKDKEALRRFMQDHSLSFPIVRKESKGAASTGVTLITSETVVYPFVAQEFCDNNEGDLRILVVGEKIFGYARKNRENDFRASGSGKKEYIPNLPMDCVKIAHKISSASSFRCMTYDFIQNNASQWVIAEISYTTVSDGPAKCSYYYSAENDFEKIDLPVGLVEGLIIEDMCGCNRN
jgi:hypothetical protein